MVSHVSSTRTYVTRELYSAVTSTPGKQKVKAPPKKLLLSKSTASQKLLK